MPAEDQLADLRAAGSVMVRSTMALETRQKERRGGLGRAAVSVSVIVPWGTTIGQANQELKKQILHILPCFSYQF